MAQKSFNSKCLTFKEVSLYFEVISGLGRFHTLKNGQKSEQVPKIDLNSKVNPFGLGRFWATLRLFKKWLRNHSIASV